MEQEETRRPLEAYSLSSEEAAALVAAVKMYAESTEDGSPEWEAIRPVFGLFVANGPGNVPKVRLTIRQPHGTQRPA